MLKPSNIKGKTFNTEKNGYDQEEVHAFLAEIASQVVELNSANEDNEAKIFKLVEKINEYREDEEAIKTVMITAQKEANKTVSDAKAQARDMIESAKTEQVRLAEQSSAECERIIRDHKEKCVQLIKENTEVTEKKINDIRKSYESEKASYENLKREVTLFKANLTELYNKQLHLIMEIPQLSQEEIVDVEEEIEVDISESEVKIEEIEEIAEVTTEEINQTAENSETKREKVDKILNTGSFEPVIPKQNPSDLQFGRKN